MLLVTFVLTLTFLTAAMTLLVTSPSPVQVCGARLGRYRHVDGVWHEICYPPHFLDVVTRCKSRTYGASLKIAYPIDTVGYVVGVFCLNFFPLKQIKLLSIYFAKTQIFKGEVL